MDQQLYDNLLTLLAVTITKAAAVGMLAAIFWRIKM